MKRKKLREHIVCTIKFFRMIEPVIRLLLKSWWVGISEALPTSEGFRSSEPLIFKKLRQISNNTVWWVERLAP